MKRVYTQRAGADLAKNLYIPGNLSAEQFTLEIDDEANPDGYVQIGLLEIAKGLLLPTPPATGAEYGFISRSVVTESEGGAQYMERRQKPRRFRGALPYVAHDTALVQFYELLRRYDVDVPFIFWPNITDAKNELRESFLARLDGLDAITRALHDRDMVLQHLREVL